MNITMYIGSAGSPTSWDTAWKSQFESWGHTVTFASEGDAADPSADLLVTLESVNSSNVANLDGQGVPILTLEGATHDEFGLGDAGATDGTVADITIRALRAPITDGYAVNDVVTWSDGVADIGHMGSPVNDVVQIGDNASGQSVISLVEEGDTDELGNVATERRVFLAGGNDPSTLTAAALAIVEKAVNWAAASIRGPSVKASGNDLDSGSGASPLILTGVTTQGTEDKLIVSITGLSPSSANTITAVEFQDSDGSNPVSMFEGGAGNHDINVDWDAAHTAIWYLDDPPAKTNGRIVVTFSGTWHSSRNTVIAYTVNGLASGAPTLIGTEGSASESKSVTYTPASAPGQLHVAINSEWNTTWDVTNLRVFAEEFPDQYYGGHAAYDDTDGTSEITSSWTRISWQDNSYVAVWWPADIGAPAVNTALPAITATGAIAASASGDREGSVGTISASGALEVTTDAPAVAINTALVVGYSGGLTTGDQVVKDRLETILGHTVTVKDDSDGGWTPTNYDLLVIVPSTNSSNTEWLFTEGVPIVTTEGATWDESELVTGFGLSADELTEDVVVRDPTHPIMQGWSQDEIVKFTNNGSAQGFMQTLAPGVDGLAEIKNRSGYWGVLAAEAGTVKPARIAFVAGAVASDWTSNATIMFDRAVSWVLNNLGKNVTISGTGALSATARHDGSAAVSIAATGAIIAQVDKQLDFADTFFAEGTLADTGTITESVTTTSEHDVLLVSLSVEDHTFAGQEWTVTFDGVAMEVAVEAATGPKDGSSYNYAAVFYVESPGAKTADVVLQSTGLPREVSYRIEALTGVELGGPVDTAASFVTDAAAHEISMNNPTGQAIGVSVASVGDVIDIDPTEGSEEKAHLDNVSSTTAISHRVVPSGDSTFGWAIPARHVDASIAITGIGTVLAATQGDTGTGDPGGTGRGIASAPSYAEPLYTADGSDIPAGALDAGDYGSIAAWLDDLEAQGKPGKIGSGTWDFSGLGKREITQSIYGYDTGTGRPVLDAGGSGALYFHANNLRFQYLHWKNWPVALCNIDDTVYSEDGETDNEYQFSSSRTNYSYFVGPARNVSTPVSPGDNTGLRVLDCVFEDCDTCVGALKGPHSIRDVHFGRNEVYDGKGCVALLGYYHGSLRFYQNHVHDMPQGTSKGNHVGTIVWMNANRTMGRDVNPAVYIDNNEFYRITSTHSHNKINGSVVADIRQVTGWYFRNNIVKDCTNSAHHSDCNALYAKCYDITIDNCLFENCGANSTDDVNGSEGGIITFKGGDSFGPVMVTDCDFIAGATSDCPMILSSHGQFTIKRCTFKDFQTSLPRDWTRRNTMVHTYSGGVYTIQDCEVINCGGDGFFFAHRGGDYGHLLENIIDVNWDGTNRRDIILGPSGSVSLVNCKTADGQDLVLT